MSNVRVFRSKYRFVLVLSLALLISFVTTHTAFADDGDDLLKAAFNGEVENVKALLDKGVDVNFQNKGYGASALHAASETKRKKIVTMLLNRGADVNLQSKEGHTALLAASYNGHEDIVKILLLAGAEVNHKNQADETALSLAREQKFTGAKWFDGAIKLLLQVGAKDIVKRCPNPNVKYETWSVKVYWQWFVAGYITERTRTDKYLCARYVYQNEHSVDRGSVLFPLSKLESRKEKEAGLVTGFKIFYAMYELSFGLTDELRQHYKIDEIFMERHAPRFETVTGLKFGTAMEWFEWIQSNKDRLVLSKDGKHVVVR